MQVGITHNQRFVKIETGVACDLRIQLMELHTVAERKLRGTGKHRNQLSGQLVGAVECDHGITRKGDCLDFGSREVDFNGARCLP